MLIERHITDNKLVVFLTSLHCTFMLHTHSGDASNQQYNYAAGLTTGVRVLAKTEDFLFAFAPRPTSGATQRIVQWLLCAISWGVKWPWLYPNHSPPSDIGICHAVAHLVEALRFMPSGRGFDPRWCHCNFFIDVIIRAALRPGSRLSLEQKLR